MPSNDGTPHSKIAHTALVNIKFLFFFKGITNNDVTPQSKIVHTALVNDSTEIFVCLQKDAKQCCDVT